MSYFHLGLIFLGAIGAGVNLSHDSKFYRINTEHRTRLSCAEGENVHVRTEYRSPTTKNHFFHIMFSIGMAWHSDKIHQHNELPNQ